MPKLLDNNNNLKQKESGKSKWQSVDQSKEVLKMEIDELWQLMTKKFVWRILIVSGRMINQSMNLIDKEGKMK